ncbi:MAG: carboxylesterase/lipase family protein [Planctomycetota bacterium]
MSKLNRQATSERASCKHIVRATPLRHANQATPLSIGVVLLFYTVVAFAETTYAAETLTISTGPIRGTESKDETVEAFKGIPYAAPPVGDLRWRPPQEPQAWEEVRECDKFGPKALQNKKTEGQSEDCLYLNVWRPREASDSPLPVMVWIHGGGFTQGSGHEASYDGTALAKRGVVLVTINYRLGAFGFMAHPDLSAESEHSASGNYAILDQIKALEWVQKNIAKFGGDPNRVTIFGESAGGTSVYLLTATPLSKGLFHGAILQSPWLDPVIFRDLKQESPTGPAAEVDGEEQTRKLFGEDEENILAKLRALPAEDVLSKIKQRWPVATDGWVFPQTPYQIYAEGQQHDIPTMIGTNQDEGTMFAPRTPFGGTLESFEDAMVERFGESGKEVAEFYSPEPAEDLRKSAVQLITDTWFVQPAREFARAMNKQGTPTYMYHFTKPVWGWMGAAHAAEIQYVFGNLNNPNAADAKLQDLFSSYWVQFAKTGNPNPPGVDAWPQFVSGQEEHLIMNDEIKVEANLRAEACDLLDKVLEQNRNPAPAAISD